MDRVVSKDTIRRERRSRLIKLSIVIAAVAVVVVILLTIFARGVGRKDITFGTVDRGPIQLTISTNGKVMPVAEEAVVSPIASRILAVYHRMGDSVHKGAPLIQLDLMSTKSDYEKQVDRMKMMEYQLEQLEAQNASTISNMEMQLKVMHMQINQKRVVLANARRLDSVGGGTAGRIREVELNLKVAEMEYDQLKLKVKNQKRIANAQRNIKALEVEVGNKSLREVQKVLAEAELRAPLTGIVTFINTQVGSKVGNGTQVAVISDFSRFRIDGEMPDSYRNKVQSGTAVDIHGGAQNIEGQICSIAPTASNGMVGFTVQYPDSLQTELRAGQKVELFIRTAKREDVLRIPNGQYYSNPGLYELFVRDGDEIVKCEVRLGESSHDYVEVISGLKPGDEVVISDMKRFAQDTRLVIK